MKTSTLSLFFLLILFISVISADAQTAAKLFTVDDAADTHDTNVGDGTCADANGKCTLRAAIEEANSTFAQDGVNFALPLPSVINLTLGELTITENIYIAGPGARRLTVQRSTAPDTPQFRIFRLQASNNQLIPPTIRGMTIKNGNVQGDGGGIYIEYQSMLRVFDAAITGNTAAGSAGGIFGAGVLFLVRSLVSSNTANGLYAGGVVNINHGTNTLIANSTLTNNTGGKGGAIYNTGNLLLVNDTISHNTARDSGSSVMSDSIGTVNVLNTIIGMDNTAISSLQGAFTSLGNNLITDARNSTGFTNGTSGDQVSNNNTINPLLGDLTDNGGQTDTRALLTGSPALNTGNSCIVFGGCPAPLNSGFRLFNDQRRVSRFGSSVDVGAYESINGSGSGSSAFFAFGANQPRLAGSLVVLTIPESGEKLYRTVLPFGGYGFRNLNLDGGVFIEIRSKRAGLSSFSILDFDALRGSSLTNGEFEQNGIKFTWSKQSEK